MRVIDEARTGRLTLETVAAINLSRGTVKPQGGHALTPEEADAVQVWIADRQALEAARRLDDAIRLMDGMGRAAHWAQTQAGEPELEAITDDMLMAMHDLRTVLLRKKAQRLKRAGAGD